MSRAEKLFHICLDYGQNTEYMGLSETILKQAAEIERLKDHLVAQALVRVQLEAKCNDPAAKLAAANVERWEPVEDDFSYEETDLHNRLEMSAGEFLLLRNQYKALGAIVLPRNVRLCRCVQP